MRTDSKWARSETTGEVRRRLKRPDPSADDGLTPRDDEEGSADDPDVPLQPDLNEKGQVLLHCTDPALDRMDPAGVGSYLWQAGRLTRLTRPGSSVVAYGLSDSGQLVGVEGHGAAQMAVRVYRGQPIPLDVGSPNAFACAVNDRGTAVGTLSAR